MQFFLPTGSIIIKKVLIKEKIHSFNKMAHYKIPFYIKYLEYQHINILAVVFDYNRTCALSQCLPLQEM